MTEWLLALADKPSRRNLAAAVAWAADIEVTAFRASIARYLADTERHMYRSGPALEVAFARCGSNRIST
jgi:hypothetical protein